MSPQLSCGNTCQIWTWYSIGNQCFDNGEKSGNYRNGGNCFSKPHPTSAMSYFKVRISWSPAPDGCVCFDLWVQENSSSICWQSGRGFLKWAVSVYLEGLWSSAHCNHFTWASLHFKLLATWLLVWHVVQANNKGNIKAPHHGPFVRGIQLSRLAFPP